MDAYIGRFVLVVVTPVVMGLAAWFSVWAAENLPGAPNIAAKDLGEIATGAVLGVALVAYKWLDNRGNHEVQEANIDAAGPQG